MRNAICCISRSNTFYIANAIHVVLSIAVNPRPSVQRQCPCRTALIQLYDTDSRATSSSAAGAFHEGGNLPVPSVTVTKTGLLIEINIYGGAKLWGVPFQTNLIGAQHQEANRKSSRGIRYTGISMS